MHSNTFKQIQDRMIKIAKEKQFPVITHFELTARCNLDCKMCYVHTQDNAKALKAELTTDQWKSIFDQAINAGMLFANLSGGECLIRKDFKELYQYLWDKHIYVTVLTNGVLLNDEYVDFFKKYPPALVQISLYGSDENGYLRVTGHKGFDKAIHAIESLRDANIDVRVVTTPNKFMGDDYLEIIRLCRKRKYPFTEGNIALMPSRDDCSNDDYFLSVDEMIELSIKRAQMKRKLIPLDTVPEVHGSMKEIPPNGLTCNAGKCSALVSWDGKMYPCVAILENGVSVLDVGFDNAWINTMKTASCVAQGIECVGCAYESICPICPAYRLKDLHCGHCNPSVCEMYRKLVSVGVKKLRNKSN